MIRTSRVRIHVSALRHNFSRVRAYAPESRVISVIKSEAYGHGMVRVAEILAESDAFAVACVDEALGLRAAGIRQPIVVLQGFYSRQQLDSLAGREIQPVIHHPAQLDMLEQASLKPLSVWLKLDTGMGRLGFQADQFEAALQRLKGMPSIETIRLMSHFANGDDPAAPSNTQQIDEFVRLTAGHQEEKSLANSAGLIRFPEARFDWVRPGIMLYGSSPVQHQSAAELDLQPVMSLQSRVIAVKQLRQGDSVGYGSLWVCPEAMPVGFVATGYADGYPRHAPTGTPVSINGQITRSLGRVSMDAIAVDLRPVPQVKLGDVAELWGQHVSVDDVAKHAETIGYELLCHAGGACQVEICD